MHLLRQLVWLLVLSAICETAAKKCKVIPLKSRKVIRADTVFTGTVLSYLVRRKFGGGSGRRRVFPGHAARVMVKSVFRSPEAESGGKQSVLRQGDQVIVEGLGNPKICVSRPRIGDTRLFFAGKLSPEQYGFPDYSLAHFRLKSSLLRVNLANLKHLWALERNGEKKKNSSKTPSFLGNNEGKTR